MPDKNGWPDGETPGVPLTPTKDGAESYHPADVAETWRYIGPAITPDGEPV